MAQEPAGDPSTADQPKTDDLTGIVSTLDPGNREAVDLLLGAVYDELRALAEAKLKEERADHILQPTALVHEAYLKLVDQERVSWQGRTHFKALAAQAMHRLLIDFARSRDRLKRGGGRQRVSLDDAHGMRMNEDLDVVVFEDAMRRMHELDDRQARVVELRVLGGLTADETAQMLSVSSRTVERDWKMGQAWLRRELSRGG